MNKTLMAIKQNLCGQCLWISLVLIGFPTLLFATENHSRVAVLYPQIREPYLKIFLDIIDGIEQRFDGESTRYELDSNYDARALEAEINRKDVDVIIALGNRSYGAVKAFSRRYPVLLGAMTTIDEKGFGGIKMIPSADVVFEKLSLLVPGVREIHVVYSLNDNADIIERARELAVDKNIVLHTYASTSIREAATAYREILRRGGGPNKAIWLVPGSTTLDNAILSDVLEVAWRKRIVVFSSKPSHVKRGVLFAIYPDNLRMGRRLGELATLTALGQSSAVSPLMDVMLAVNQRTGEHLGLTIDRQLREQIDLLLPAN